MKPQENLNSLSDEELLAEAKKMKSFSFTHAFFIGILIGIVLYSVFKNTWGLLTLIPLYFIYKLLQDPKNARYEALQKVLKERNLQ
jgi:hypothetical protein